MKKLSRKNKRGREKDLGQVHQHFSFRKMNSGLLVSAAIGAFLIFDNGNVQAATMSTKETITKTSISENQRSTNDKSQEKINSSLTDNQNDSVTLAKNNENSDKQSSSDVSNTSSNSTSDMRNEQIGESDKNNSKNTANLTNNDTKQEYSLSKSDLKTSLGQNINSNLLTATDSDSTSKTDVNNKATLQMDNNKVGNVSGNNNIKLTLQTSGEGTYVVQVPESSIYNINTVALDPAYGTMTRTSQSSVTTLTYNLTYDGVVNLPITITTKNNYSAQPTPFQDIGETEKTINWSVDGVEQSPLTFTQTIKPQWDPKTPVRISPNPDIIKGVPVDTDVTYSFSINESSGVYPGLDYASAQINSAVNYGTTIDIPVPEGFTLNEASTKLVNEFSDQTTISQPGGKGSNIIITVPKGSGSQGYQVRKGYQLVGSYDIPQPETDLKVSAPAPITIVQKLGDGTDAKTMEATLPSFSDTIIGKKSDISVGKFGLTIAGGYATNQLPISDKNIVVGYFGFDNSSILSFTDAMHLKVDFPDGLMVDKITTPVNSTTLPGTTSYNYVITLTDGSTQTGTVTAGDSVSVGDNQSIASVSFTPNFVAVSAQTANLPSNSLVGQNTNVSAFIVYGHADEKYQDGTALASGDELKTTVSVSTDNSNLTGIATNVQKVVFPDDYTSQIYSIAWEDSKESGAKRAGYLGTTTWIPNFTTFDIYEPVFYYVIPATTSLNLPLKLDYPNTNNGIIGNPKVSAFVANDGRTVVKIDYTGTGYYYNSEKGGNSIYLDNNADASNSNMPWDMYVISPKTKLNNTKYSESTENNFSTNPTTNPFDTSWVEGNTANLYHVGGGVWTIQEVAGVTAQGLVKGNENLDYTTAGISDDKGSTAMGIALSIPNGTDNTLQNANAYLSVPQKSLGSGFDFVLNGDATFNQLAGTNVDNYTITYSDQSFDLYNDEEPSADSFKDASEITDWSKIKTIKVFVPKINGGDTLGRIILNGADPTVTEDAGETGYVQTALYAPGFHSYTNKNTPVIISVSGTSTVTSRYSYVDQAGITKTIDIPSLSYTLSDKKDLMPTKEQVMSNLTEADKALIPDGYLISGVELIKPTEKSWETDAPIVQPEFGQEVKYYYNNAVVQYNLVKKYATETSTKNITRTINYVDKTTDSPMPTNI